jgi:hypothetical protein
LAKANYKNKLIFLWLKPEAIEIMSEAIEAV